MGDNPVESPEDYTSHNLERDSGYALPFIMKII